MCTENQTSLRTFSYTCARDFKTQVGNHLKKEQEKQEAIVARRQVAGDNEEHGRQGLATTEAAKCFTLVMHEGP